MGGRGQGGPDKSDIMTMGVVGGLGGETAAEAPAVGVARGAVMMAEVVGLVADEELASCPPTGGCGGAGL